MKRSRKKSAPSVPACLFCKRSGNGIQFAIFSPRFKPFGTACTDCDATLPPETVVPTAAS